MLHARRDQREGALRVIAPESIDLPGDHVVDLREIRAGYVPGDASA